MDFDTGASYDDVVVAVSTLASLQVPGLGDPERVGEKCHEGLDHRPGGRPTRTRTKPCSAPGAPEGYIARRYDFALVTEHLDSPR